MTKSNMCMVTNHYCVLASVREAFRLAFQFTKCASWRFTDTPRPRTDATTPESKTEPGGDAKTMISLRWLSPLLLLVRGASSFSSFSPVSTAASTRGNWRNGVTDNQRLGLPLVSRLSSEVNGDIPTEGTPQLNGFQRILTSEL